MKKIRWSDFSLVSKIMIEVGVLAVLLFSINMLFYARINNSMQEMDDVYASNAQITELGQVFDDVQDSMYQYLKVKNSQALMDYYQNEAKYRQELEKLNERNTKPPSTRQILHASLPLSAQMSSEYFQTAVYLL